MEQKRNNNGGLTKIACAQAKEPSGSAGVEFLLPGACLVQRIKRIFYRLGKLERNLCGAHSLLGTDEQRIVECASQAPERVADGWLGKLQHGCGFGGAAGLQQGEKNPQEIKIKLLELQVCAPCPRYRILVMLPLGFEIEGHKGGPDRAPLKRFFY